jgi:hypothetical protein
MLQVCQVRAACVLPCTFCRAEIGQVVTSFHTKCCPAHKNGGHAHLHAQSAPCFAALQPQSLSDKHNLQYHGTTAAAVPQYSLLCMQQFHPCLHQLKLLLLQTAMDVPCCSQWCTQQHAMCWGGHDALPCRHALLAKQQGHQSIILVVFHSHHHSVTCIIGTPPCNLQHMIWVAAGEQQRQTDAITFKAHSMRLGFCHVHILTYCMHVLVIQACLCLLLL